MALTRAYVARERRPGDERVKVGILERGIDSTIDNRDCLSLPPRVRT